MEEKWQQVCRRRGKLRTNNSRSRDQLIKAPKVGHNGKTIVTVKSLTRLAHVCTKIKYCVPCEMTVEEEMVEPVPDVSAQKQTQIIERVRAIAVVLRDSELLQDALNAIVKHFDLHSGNAFVNDAEKRVDAGNTVTNRLAIVGYGLGSFCASSNAVHQLAFLVVMMEALNKIQGKRVLQATESSERLPICAEIYDPAMNKSDIAMAHHFKLKVIQENERGWRRVKCNTVFFMPHCGKMLYQNVLACNWGPAIQNLVIIGNSFSAYRDRLLAAKEREKLLLVSVLPYLDETSLPCGVMKSHRYFNCYEAAFNDLSVHTFPIKLLKRALEENPHLNNQMIDVATNKLENSNR